MQLNWVLCSEKVIRNRKRIVSTSTKLEAIELSLSGYSLKLRLKHSAPKTAYRKQKLRQCMEVDLSKQLTASPAQPELQQQVEATTQNGDMHQQGVSKINGPDRATKAATGGSEVMFRELRHSKEDPKVVAEKYRKQYLRLKKRLQVLTLGIGGVGLVSAYVSYSPEIAARIAVPQYGFMHLELIPMLVGFFTYKIATFIQAIEEAIPQVEKIDTIS